MTDESSSRALSAAEGRKELRFCNSYTRMPVLLDLAAFMAPEDWLTLLGEEWSSCDNIAQYALDLRDTPFADLEDDPLEWRDFMMTAEEREALAALPDVVTVFRGCYANNKRGLCWTLEPETAERFPTFHRYRQDCQPLLIRATVSRDRILALQLDRGEVEVIATRPKFRSIRHIRNLPSS